MTSAILTPNTCKKAWKALLPTLEAMYEFGIADKYDGVVIVLDPTVPWSPSPAELPTLFTDVIGGKDTPPEYTSYAVRKAYISWRTGRSSRDIQQNAPHLYEGGDVKWGGSVVREGLVVSFSGVQANLDESISGMFADLMLGMARQKMTRKGGIMAAKRNLLP